MFRQCKRVNELRRADSPVQIASMTKEENQHYALMRSRAAFRLDPLAAAFSIIERCGELAKSASTAGELKDLAAALHQSTETARVILQEPHPDKIGGRRREKVLPPWGDGASVRPVRPRED